VLWDKLKSLVTRDSNVPVVPLASDSEAPRQQSQVAASDQRFVSHRMRTRTIVPWCAGQYVTYFLERSDKSWTAIALRVQGQTQDGFWVISADFKTRSGESRAYIRANPNADSIPEFFSLSRIQIIRGGPISDICKWDHPDYQLTIALNLFAHTRGQYDEVVLRSPAHPVDYPCGIDRAYSLVMDRYHHDLNPRVLITGVASMSVPRGQNELAVTSLGCNNPTEYKAGTFDDFIDFSHPIRVDHDCFSLTYPATWFLQSDVQHATDTNRRYSRAIFGGNTCAGVLSVTLFRGDDAQISAEREIIRNRIREFPKGATSAIPFDSTDASAEVGNFESCGFDFSDNATKSITTIGLFCSEDRLRLAQVNVTCCIAKANPRGAETLERMRTASREIIQTFQFI
jgi:hypothetical protein